MTAVTLEMIVFDRSDLDENTGISDEIGSSLIARKALVSSRRKSLSPKGVRVGEEVETIDSEVGVGFPLLEISKNPSTS
ncbi:hypothetical protein Tco_0952663 [Tanacetum coccineum]|uniref:Uncharacterized protein n=1 Tax=Tanacetum coccineum TaxID=301880 RepID=A0ABQ5E0J0_9ASTR